MSELNVYHHELRPDEYAEFYLKYEADKVIAEKDEEIATLNDKLRHYPIMVALLESNKMEIAELKADYKEACDRLQTANLIKDEQLAATRRQKYRRCLAMARWCNRMFSSTFGKERYWQKWNRRWMELAKIFKEEK